MEGGTKSPGMSKSHKRRWIAPSFILIQQPYTFGNGLFTSLWCTNKTKFSKKGKRRCASPPPLIRYGAYKIDKSSVYEWMDERLQNLIVSFHSIKKRNILKGPELYLIFKPLLFRVGLINSSFCLFNKLKCRRLRWYQARMSEAHMSCYHNSSFLFCIILSTIVVFVSRHWWYRQELAYL